MSENKLKPGMTLGMYPQLQETWPDFLETKVRLAVSKIKYLLASRKYRLQYIVNKVNAHQQALKNLSGQAMELHIEQLRKQLHREGLKEQLVTESFATVREVSGRVLGKRHFDVQLMGGWVMINGMIAEMETGQGKTLTATLPACTAALAGIPVHIVTSNDYLAERDEEIMRPLYQQMGISSASVVDGMEAEKRAAAYQCDIVHSTSQQITFDYLRDRLEMGEDIGKLQIQFKHLQDTQDSTFLLRGLCFTIIDEADSLLIDEAKTPLIISQTNQSAEQDQLYFDALYLATSITKNEDFIVDESAQDIRLTDSGISKITELAKSLSENWQKKKYREMMVALALKAKHLFHRDKQYLVREDKVEIIDPLTGRAMPDRSWEHGLHQLIEAKEGCEISAERNPLAKIGYQKFFKRYLRLSGMSGTVTEVAGELNSVYGLRVIKIPTHQISRRKMYPEKVYQTSEQKWQAFVQKVRLCQQSGQPLLIGTNTVADSEKVSAILSKHKLPHKVLNALQDKQEAEIIATAGQKNNITVATNMAGRGTDIALGAGVEELGGLHVIATERNDARRIDRQLYGRCARQGDPGSAEGFMSLQDDNLVNFYPGAMLKIMAWFCRKNKPLPAWLGRVVLAMPQKWLQYKHYQLRCLLIKQEKQQSKTLSFTGRM